MCAVDLGQLCGFLLGVELVLFSIVNNIDYWELCGIVENVGGAGRPPSSMDIDWRGGI